MTFQCVKKSTKIIKNLIEVKPVIKLICKGSRKFASLKTINIFSFCLRQYDFVTSSLITMFSVEVDPSLNLFYGRGELNFQANTQNIAKWSSDS
jgi:hypothetical protein